MGSLLFVSGDAYRVTHQQHHRVFPGPDDPEGEAARLTPLRCLIDGPLHVPRIWLWAFRRARRRGWLIAEALVPFAALGGGLAVLPWTPSLLVYVVLVVAGGWLYPLLTVYLPHHRYGDEPVTHGKDAPRTPPPHTAARADLPPRASPLSPGALPQAAGARSPTRSPPAGGRRQPAPRALVR